jgi:hypothetical protein
VPPPVPPPAPPPAPPPPAVGCSGNCTWNSEYVPRLGWRWYLAAECSDAGCSCNRPIIDPTGGGQTTTPCF